MKLKKYFIYKEIVQSNTHCKIPMVDVCYDEELEENNNDLNSGIISCRKNGANFKGCVREDINKLIYVLLIVIVYMLYFSCSF